MCINVEFMCEGCSVFFNTKKSVSLTSVLGESNSSHTKEHRRWRAQLRKPVPVDFSKNVQSFSGFNKNDFVDYTQNPETAAMLYHANSGHARYLKADDLYDKNNNLKKDNVDALKQEIQDELLSNEEKEQMLYKFATQQGRYSGNLQCPETNNGNENIQSNVQGLPSSIDAHILGCGTCGKKNVNGLCGKFCCTVLLSDMPDIIKLKKKQVDHYIQSKESNKIIVPLTASDDFQEINLQKLRSVYYSSTLDKYFHLHPEMVHLDKEKR